MTPLIIDGYDIYIDSYYQQMTYSGIYTGYPDSSKRIIYLLSNLRNIWGERTIYIDPKWNTLQRLPKIACAAWLSSSKTTPNGGNAICGSHAFIMWFTNNDDIKPIDIIKDELSQLKWEYIATNYDL